MVQKVGNIPWRERVLLKTQRLFTPKPLQTPVLPESLDDALDLFESGMFEESSFWHRQIFGRLVPYLRVDKDSLEPVKGAAAEGTLVYVTPLLQNLEFNLFNYLAYDHSLPRAVFNNSVRNSRWVPRRLNKSAAKKRMQYLKYCETLPDPIRSGLLTTLLTEGKSVLLALDPLDPAYVSPAIRDTLFVLIQAQRQSQKPIFVVPQQLVWDKRPPREKPSIFEALFGVVEKPGFLRKLILLIRHFKKRSVIRFGTPIDLRPFAAAEAGAPANTAAVAKLYQQLLQSFVQERRSLTGPPIRGQGWFVERILEDTDLEKSLYALAKEKQKEVADFKRLAAKYAKEIASDISHPFLEFAIVCLNWFFGKRYDGIHVDPEEIRKLKKAAGEGTLILAPNHRSHVDYLLLGYLCHQHDIVIPHVAGGLNLAFWPLGWFARKCGAFFLRRSFQGNPLYKQVFQTYLKVLVREGYLQEFFIEGGRSRTGKLRAPKMGMLSMYSQVLFEKAAADIRFVPVCITYETVPEQKSYAQEIGGKPKQAEKTMDLLKLRRFLGKGRHGRIYVHFDEPISWRETVLETAGSLEAAAEKKTAIVGLLANRIMHAINRQAVVTPTALTATALLTQTSRGVTTHRSLEIFQELLAYLHWKKIKVTEGMQSPTEIPFREGLQELQSNRLITLHKGLEGDFFEIPTASRPDLDYYKNTAIHYFVSLALWSNLLLRQRTDRFILNDLVQDYEAVQKLFLYEFKFSTRLPLKEHLEKLCQYLAHREILSFDGENITRRHEGKRWLKTYESLLANFVASYWIALKTCLASHVDRMEVKTLIKLMHQHGKHLLLLGHVQHPEAVSQANFENAIAAFLEQGILTHHEKEQGPAGRHTVTTLKNSRLDQNLQVLLEQLLNNSF